MTEWGRFAARVEQGRKFTRAVARAGQALPYALDGPRPRPRDAAWAFPARGPWPRPNHYGATVNWDYELRLEHPDLVVPERAFVLPAEGPGERAKHDPAAGPCPRCNDAVRPPAADPGTGEVDPETRSLIACPVCLRTEWDDLLDAQRALAGTPPAEPPSSRYETPDRPAESRAAARRRKRAAKP